MTTTTTRRPLPAGRTALSRARSAAVKLMMAGLGAVAAVLLFTYGFMPLAVNHGDDIPVPDLVGLSLEEAQRLLTQHKLRGRSIAERVDPGSSAGVVLEQKPRSGFRTRRGRTVGLVVSIGRGEVSVPDVLGESFRHAEIMLTRDGLPIGRVSRRHSTEPVGEVLNVSPPPGSGVIRGRAVDVLLSSGPEQQAFLMPDFSGGDPDAVARGLRRLGCLVDVVYPAAALSLSGEILSHTPPPGHRLLAGDEVRLLVGEK